MKATARSCLYRGHVWHARRGPVPHRFRLRLTFAWLDLDELDTVFRGRLLWSTRRWAPMWFRRRDHLGPPDRPLRQCVLDECERLTGLRPTGAVRMLTLPRTFGLTCNPVSFYYCHDAADRLQAVVAEITNTPWLERHRYAVARPPGDDGDGLHARFAKTFHVSPFLPMQLDYDWRFSAPGAELTIAMQDLRGDEPVFAAGVQLRAVPITGRSLAAALLRHPWPALKVWLGIYGHALWLWLRRAPFHPHPRHHKEHA